MSDLPLTCAQARRLNHLELDGTLSADKSQALRTHCDQCRRCRHDRQSLFALQADLIRARFAFRRRLPPAPDVSGQVIARFSTQPQRRLWLNLSGVLARAAAVTAVVVIAAGWRLPAAVHLPADQSTQPEARAVSPSVPVNGGLVAQAPIPAFEFEDEISQSLSFTVLPGRTGGDDPSAPAIPSGPVRLRMD